MPYAALISVLCFLLYFYPQHRAMVAGNAEELMTYGHRSTCAATSSPIATAAMLEAAARRGATLHFGLREDPHQIELEKRLAEMLGQEDALVFPTCTMANTTALMLLAPAARASLPTARRTCMTSEAGAASALAGRSADSTGG